MSYTLKVSDETYEKIKDQLSREEDFDVNDYDDLIGKSFLFRCVTYHQVGQVVGRFGDFLELADASWVANSGQFEDAIRTGTLAETEYVGQYFINLQTVVDFVPWAHVLLRG